MILFYPMSAKLKNCRAPTKDDLSVTLIARGPDSAVADAVRRHANRFVDLGIELRVIFASIEPASVFAGFVEMAGMYNGQNCLDASLRWAKNPALLDAHEQLVLGTEHCWSGDIMRRAADVRFSLDLFESNGASAVDLGRSGFSRALVGKHQYSKIALSQCHTGSCQPASCH